MGNHTDLEREPHGHQNYLLCGRCLQVEKPYYLSALWGSFLLLLVIALGIVTFTTPISRRRKLRCRELERLAQGPDASKWQSWALIPSGRTSRSTPFTANIIDLCVLCCDRSHKLGSVTKKKKKAIIWPQAYPSIVPPLSGHSDCLVDKHTIQVRLEFFYQDLNTDVQRMPSSSFWGHWLGQGQLGPSLSMSNSPIV